METGVVYSGSFVISDWKGKGKGQNYTSLTNAAMPIEHQCKSYTSRKPAIQEIGFKGIRAR